MWADDEFCEFNFFEEKEESRVIRIGVEFYSTVYSIKHV